MADMVTAQELENAKIDARTIGESVNENKIVTPRYGAPFKSMPMIAEEMQSVIGTIIAGGVPASIVADASGLSQQQVNNNNESALSDRYTKSEINSALLLKSNQADVDSSLTLKADKSETFTKSEVNTLVSPKADTAYVDSALSSLSTQATKFYPTLSEANADIANLSVNQPVQVGEAVGGGLYYKATAGATSLTKSAYDPLNQAVNKTKSILKPNFILTDQQIDSAKKKVIEFSKYQFDSSNSVLFDTITTTKSVTTTENLVIKYSNLTATEALARIKLNTLSQSSELIIFPADSVANGVKTTYWDYLIVGDATIATVNTDADGGFRVLIPFIDAQANVSIGLMNIFEESEYFTPKAQTELATFSGNGVSSHSSGAVQLKVMPTTLIDFGYTATSSDAIEFVKAIYKRLKFKSRKTVLKQYPFELENLLLPQDSYSFDITGVTASFKLVKPLGNTKLGEAFTVKSVSVKNSTTAPIVNGLISLKVNFDFGQVKSSDQIRVFDSAGTEYDIQFAPDHYVNYRIDLSNGYHIDGSLRSGEIHLYDSLAIDADKSYEVRIYESPQIKPVVKLTKVSETASEVKYSAYGYSLAFDKNSESASLKNITLKNAKVINCSNVIRMLVANSSDPNVISTGLIANLKSYKVVNEGSVFCDVKVTTYNPTFNTIEANALKATTIYRLFKNGVLRIMNCTQATKEIGGTVLYGVLNCLSVNNVATSASYSAKYSMTKAAYDTDELRYKAIMYHGDVHRDGINYGATRPENSFVDVSTTKIDVRYGWRDTVGSASSIKWNIPKDWAWLSELAITLEPIALPDSQTTAQLNHIPTGFIGKRQLWTAAKNQLLSSVYKYSMDNLEWWYSADAEPYGGNPNYPTATMYVYSTELMRFIKDGIGSFDAIYNKFIAMVKGRFGTDLSMVGNAYSAGTFAISQESRHIAPALQWLYQHALKVGDTAKQNELKVLAKSIADALADYYAAKGGIGLVGNGSDVGSSNVLGNGMRFLAIAIAMGQDATGTMLTAFNGCEARLIDTTKFMPFQNRLDDGLGDTEAKSRYLHYVAYAIYGYRLACSLLNREPAFDITPFMLNSLSGNGDIKDYEYCVSESRRGERNTVGFMLHALTYKHLLGHVYAANAAMQSLITNGMDEKANPKRMFGFDGKTSDPDNLRTSVAFNLHALADLWLSYYYQLYK